MQIAGTDAGDDEHAQNYKCHIILNYFFIPNIFIQGKTFSHWLFSHVALCTHINNTESRGIR